MTWIRIAAYSLLTERPTTDFWLEKETDLIQDKHTCIQEFGGCPVCGDNIPLKLGSERWGTCTVHKTRWLVGNEPLSMLETDERTATERAADALTLDQYHEVKPLSKGEEIPEADANLPALAHAQHVVLFHARSENPDLIYEEHPLSAEAAYHRVLSLLGEARRVVSELSNADFDILHGRVVAEFESALPTIQQEAFYEIIAAEQALRATGS